MKINIFQNGQDKGTVVQMLQTISYGDEAVIEYSRNSGFQLTTQDVAEGAYLLISAVFLFIFFLSLYKIVRLKKKYPETKIEDISFINTNVKGTPFSFLKSIFWNNKIDLHSKPGQQIFNHEIAHIKEKHSYDKIFMNIILIFFWINPFFWLMRKELYMIHEFIADKESLEDSDINTFAEMILQTVYPGQNFSFANNFFYSPIKRRIKMLTKNKNPKVNYISRLLVLPLAVIVLFAFTFKVKNSNPNLYNGKTITVVIDAGHGGTDNGAVSADGAKEKDITLAIAKKIDELNSNQHIKIVLTRDDDKYLSVKDKVVFAENNNADLFISIHVNSSSDKQLNGFAVLIAKNHNEQDQLLGSSLINELKKSYKTADKIGERNKGVWVLDHNVCPAALVECGFLSNPGDLSFIRKSADQMKVAENILDAINIYASSKESADSKSTGVINNSTSNTPLIKDTIAAGTLIFVDGKEISKDEMKSIPSSNIQSINVLKGKIAIKKYGAKGKDGVIEITTKNKNIYATKNDSSNFDKIPKGILFFVDGKESSQDVMNDIPPGNIQSINVLKGDSAEKKYGLKGRNGVIEIITKKTGEETNHTQTYLPEPQKDSIPRMVFTKVENEASFPGGQTAWQKYIAKKIQASLDSFTEADYGTCVLKFIVNTDGSVSNVEATTMQGTHLAQTSVNAIKNGPKWIPASQNGHTVASYRLQPVTLTNPGNQGETPNGKALTKVQVEASFPGGPTAWQKYIVKKIQVSLASFTKADYGTCIVKFIVNTDGSISNVEATTMKGTHLAQTSVNAIKNGPKWIAASQNGKAVAAYRLQPVTLTNPEDSQKNSTKS